MKQVLLNPGPVNLTERVRRALLGPDLCHREPEFARLLASVRARLLAVYGLDPVDWSAVLVAGSGTAAVEALLTSCVPRDGRLLVVANGVYGERMAEVARAHGIDFDCLRLEWGAEIVPADLAARLARHGATHVALVHHETTTGRLNDLRAAEVCRGAGARVLLDAVSSFGGEAIDFEGLDGCAATANKCLHGVPGVSFAVVRREALERGAEPARSVYLDLRAMEAAQASGGTAFTLPVQILYALDEALSELEDEGGWRARSRHYATLATQVRAGLARIGVRPLLSEGASSSVLHAYELPPGTSYDELHDGLKQRGFVIYAGQGGLRRRIFRIAHMGAIGADDVARLLRAMEDVLPTGDAVGEF